MRWRCAHIHAMLLLLLVLLLVQWQLLRVLLVEPLQLQVGRARVAAKRPAVPRVPALNARVLAIVRLRRFSHLLLQRPLRLGQLAAILHEASLPITTVTAIAAAAALRLMLLLLLAEATGVCFNELERLLALPVNVFSVADDRCSNLEIRRNTNTNSNLGESDQKQKRERERERDRQTERKREKMGMAMGIWSTPSISCFDSAFVHVVKQN